MSLNLRVGPAIEQITDANAYALNNKRFWNIVSLSGNFPTTTDEGRHTVWSHSQSLQLRENEAL